MLILCEMLKIALNYAKKMTNFISYLNMIINTPIESLYQIESICVIFSNSLKSF
jgi:hypothetical protein